MARPSMLMTLVVVALLSLQTVDAANRPAKLHVIESSHPVHPSKYIVQFSRPPAADRRAQARAGASSSALKSGAEAQHDDFAVYCRRNRLPVKIDRTYSTLFNGAAVHVKNESDLAKLAASPAVKKVYPVIRYSQAPPQARPLSDKTVVPQFAHALTGVDQFRKQYPDVDGRNVKVAVVDSGIDWKHPAFAVPGQKCETFKGPGCRVLYGQDFVGDDYDASTPGNNVPKPDGDPMDSCNGHGVHCAGIIGGNDATIQGVAPGAVLGAYRVFGCKGTVDNDVILAALEAAYQDGMEIINLSLGGGRVDASYPEAQAIDTLVANDVFVVSAASNEGDEGYSMVTSPGIASKGLGIASFDNTHQYVASAQFGGVAGLTDSVAFVYSGSEGITGKFDEQQTYKVIRSPNAESETGDGCAPFAPNTFAGGVALIRRGKCAFTDKALAAKNAGAIGAIIYNGQQGPMGGGILEPAELATYPVAFISGTPGFQIYEAAKSGGQVTVKFNNKEAFVAAETAGRPSDFSSWGLDLSLHMKPDLGGPGGHIYSAYPRAMGSYAELSGTSMATPYLAGVIALEVQRNGASQGLASYESLQRRLHITARPALLPGSDPKNPVAESVAKVGAGLVNVPALLANPLDVSPSKLELGDGFATKTRTITVTNKGNRAKRYTIGHLPSRSVEGSKGVKTAQFRYSNTFAKVSFSSQIVSVAPGQSASFVVTVDPAADQDAFWIRSGYITLTDASDDKPELSIPYALLANDYSKYPVLDESYLPSLIPGTGIDDPSVEPIVEDAKPTFDLKSKETSPALTLATVFPVRRLAVALVSAENTANVLGYLAVEDFAQTIAGTAVVLNGEVQDVNDETKTVPVQDGEYRIVLQYVRPVALKLVADPKAALETVYVSPVFIVNKSGVITTTSASTTATETSTATATATETTTSTATETSTSTTVTETSTSATQTQTGTTSTTATETSTATETTTTAEPTTTSTATETITSTSTLEPTTTTSSATATSTETSSVTSTATETTTSTGTTTATQEPPTTSSASTTTATSTSSASTSTATSTSSASTTTTASTETTSTATSTGTATSTSTSTSVEPEPTYVYGKRPGYGKRPNPTQTAAPEPVYGKRPRASPTPSPEFEPVYGKRRGN